MAGSSVAGSGNHMNLASPLAQSGAAMPSSSFVPPGQVDSTNSSKVGIINPTDLNAVNDEAPARILSLASSPDAKER